MTTVTSITLPQAKENGYDLLDNLTSASMGSRSFVYGSLSRLTQAANPETGTVPIFYYYDGAGNLTKKTDARSVSTTLTYDGLNRVKSKTYSDGTTPAVTYSYSLSDQLTREVYPSGQTVNYSFDSANRLTQVQDGVSSFIYAGGIAYTAPGGVSSLTLGNGVTEGSTWNDRHQITGRAAGSLLALSFHPCPNGATSCTTNNGNIWRENIGIGGTNISQEYRYDAEN